MGYDLFLQRQEPDGTRSSISLSEWQATVETTDYVRLSTGDWTITNPKTGEILSCPNNGGDADVYFPEEDTWHRVFSFSNFGGSINFRGSVFSDKAAISTVARTLAQKLAAVIRSESGEIYR